MELVNPLLCPFCHTAVAESAYFCSNCGKPLKPRPESISVGRQLVVYLVSFFLAPFGLVFAFKYLKQKDRSSRIIGIVSIVLTILAVVATFFVARTFLETTYRDIQTINSLIY